MCVCGGGELGRRDGKITRVPVEVKFSERIIMTLQFHKHKIMLKPVIAILKFIHMEKTVFGLTLSCQD